MNPRPSATRSLPAPLPGGIPVRDHLSRLPLPAAVIAGCIARIDKYAPKYENAADGLCSHDGRGKGDITQEGLDFVNYCVREWLTTGWWFYPVAAVVVGFVTEVVDRWGPRSSEASPSMPLPMDPADAGLGGASLSSTDRSV